MTISLRKRCNARIEHREIFDDEMLSIMRRIMSGEVTPVMIAALTVGLRVKKETVGEIAAAAQIMREFATKVDVAGSHNLVDLVGTGGDSRAHVQHLDRGDVCRGGGRRPRRQARRALVSSKSGSVDVLEALGANVMLKPAEIAQSIMETSASASCSRRTTTLR